MCLFSSSLSEVNEHILGYGLVVIIVVVVVVIIIIIVIMEVAVLVSVQFSRPY